jgi:hypothetical protein
MHFGLSTIVYQFDPDALAVTPDPTLGGAISIDALGPNLGRLHVALVNDEGAETGHAQGVDLTPREMRALGRALLNAAEYMEGTAHVA